MNSAMDFTFDKNIIGSVQPTVTIKDPVTFKVGKRKYVLSKNSLELKAPNFVKKMKLDKFHKNETVQYNADPDVFKAFVFCINNVADYATSIAESQLPILSESISSSSKENANFEQANFSNLDPRLSSKINFHSNKRIVVEGLDNSDDIPSIIQAAGNDIDPIAKRGRCMIFSYKQFDASRHREMNQKLTHHKNVIDVKALRETFEKLNFEVVEHADLSKQTTEEELCKEVQLDHHKVGCFALCLVVHGRTKKFICSDSGEIAYKYVFDLFDSCRSLEGKLKLFFIIYCNPIQKDQINRKYIQIVDEIGQEFQNRPYEITQKDKNDNLFNSLLNFEHSEQFNTIAEDCFYNDQFIEFLKKNFSKEIDKKDVIRENKGKHVIEFLFNCWVKLMENFIQENLLCELDELKVIVVGTIGSGQFTKTAMVAQTNLANRNNMNKSDYIIPKSVENFKKFYDEAYFELHGESVAEVDYFAKYAKQNGFMFINMYLSDNKIDKVNSLFTNEFINRVIQKRSENKPKLIILDLQLTSSIVDYNETNENDTLEESYYSTHQHDYFPLDLEYNKQSIERIQLGSPLRWTNYQAKRTNVIRGLKKIISNKQSYIYQ